MNPRVHFDNLEECVGETTEIRTDGGEIDDRTQHITDDDIEHGTDGEAIQDINKVREALETFQRSAEETWSEHMDGIEQSHYWLVEETDDVIVLGADDALYKEYLSPTGHDTTDYHYAVSGVMHSVAKRLTDYNWGYSYPLVIAKPDDFDSGRLFTEAVVNGYINEGLSPEQAWAYFGVEIRDISPNQWAIGCGYSDHSAVSEAVRKAKKKLPRE